jgi:L-malate glycosyltransferase
VTILLITPLFPDSLDTPRTKVTFAVYSFAKYWKAENRVIVVRPRKRSWRRALSARDERRELDGMTILDVPYFRLSALGIDLVGAMARRIIRAVLREGASPDIVLSHYNVGIRFGSRAARILGKPFVAAIHKRDIGNLGRGELGLYEPSFRSARLIVFRSRPIESKFREFLPDLRGPFYVADSGIAREEVESEDYCAGKARGIASREEVRFATAASLLPRKHVDAVICALAGLGRPWSYSIMGDGPERGALESLARSLGVADRVRFLGQVRRDEVLEELKAADVFVMVSELETFGLAYLEAMAKGCLVVGSRGWGIDGIVADGENGFLVESGDAEALAGTLDRIARMGADKLEEIGLASHRAAAALDEEKVALRYLDALRKAAE